MKKKPDEYYEVMYNVCQVPGPRGRNEPRQNRRSRPREKAEQVLKAALVLSPKLNPRCRGQVPVLVNKAIACRAGRPIGRSRRKTRRSREKAFGRILCSADADSRHPWQRPGRRPRQDRPLGRPVAAEAASRAGLLHRSEGGRQGPHQSVRRRRRGLQVRLRLRSLRKHGRVGTKRVAGRQGRNAPKSQKPRYRPPIPDHLLQPTAGHFQSHRHAWPARLRHRAE